MEVEGKHILIVGAARSGIAAARFLAARGARVTLNDVRTELDLSPDIDVNVVTGSHPDELFENADLIVVSPGVPLAIPPFARARASGVPIIGEVELATRFIKGRLVGITGSNGKTTTTALTGHLLEGSGIPVQVGGNIGTPLISLVDTSTEETFTVIEMSSFQLEAVDTMHLAAAALLNITPDHLDRYESLDSYASAKGNIFRNQTADDVAVLNADDERVVALGDLSGAEKRYFSRKRQLEAGIFLDGDRVVVVEDGGGTELITRDEIRLKGDHNLENVMAALGLGLACGADPEAMRSAVADFPGVEHRLEYVTTIRGVDFYNDSKATNVDAAIKALESFNVPVIAIFGGKDKGSDYSPLRPLLKKRSKEAILIGAATDKIAAALEGVVDLKRANSMNDAVSKAFAAAQPGSVVLLAPACASFDMFDNYEHRGRVFKTAVAELQKHNV